MRPLTLIDLHCDTLTEGKYTTTGNPDTLDDPKRVLSLSGIPGDIHWSQFYAIFVQDEYRGQEAIDFFNFNAANFHRQMHLFAERVSFCRTYSDMETAFSQNKTAAFLTVENGSALAGDLNRVQVLTDMGVRCMSLVWNGENEIGSGHTTDHGLSDFGMAAVKEMERCSMLIDVSHLNDAGFSDLLGIVKKPFLATHSNARSVNGHKRNLTDDMIMEMVRRKCLIGLNFYSAFLKSENINGSEYAKTAEGVGLEDLYDHVMHFFELGAQDCIALGSDFDGAILPDCLNTPEKAVGIYEYFISKGITREAADGILYKNARRFLRENLI